VISARSRKREPAPKPPPGSMDEWFTPWPLFHQLHAEFDFTLDVCATKESAKVPAFFSKEEDGLKHRWQGHRAWMNPPYSNIEPWVVHARLAVEAWGCKLVVGLLPAWTDRLWWTHHVEPFRDKELPCSRFSLTTRFLQGRVPFGWPGRPEGHHRARGVFPSVLLIWRRR
jgi:phage N-6-adenine-methyltransferase